MIERARLDPVGCMLILCAQPVHIHLLNVDLINTQYISCL
jgi:hypothetical protein